VVDRRLGQPSLLAKIDLVLRLQAFERRRHLLRRLRSLGNTGLDQSIYEAFQAVYLLIVFVRVYRFERCRANLRQHLADKLAMAETSAGDLLAEQSRCSSVGSHRRRRIALIGEFLQE
jgi:hypothetical protein